MRRPPGHRLLASSVLSGRWPGAVSGSKRSAPRFLAFEDPTPAGVDSAHATGASPPWGRSLSRPRRSSGFLSWGFKDAPPSISARCVRSRRGPPRGGPPSARERPSPRRLPPLPFFPASTVCSAARLAGLCASRVLSDAVLRQPSLSSEERFSCNRPWGSCRFGSCRCAFARRSTRYLGFPRCRSARIAGHRPRSQVLPRSCPTLRSVIPRQQLSRPSPVGAALSPLQGAARAAAWLRTTMRLRLRLPASGRLSAAESGARRGCCQRLRPDAPLGLFLKRAGGVLPRAPSGEAVRVRDRIGGPGRARARSASRPNSDFGVDTVRPSPDPKDRTRGGSRPAGSRHRAPKEPGGIPRGYGVAAPSLRSTMLPKDSPLCRSDPNRFLFPGSRGPRCPPDLHRRASPQRDESLWGLSGVSAAATLRRSGQPPAPRSCREVRREADFRRGPGSLRMWPCTAYRLPFFRGLLRQRTVRDR